MSMDGGEVVVEEEWWARGMRCIYSKERIVLITTSQGVKTLFRALVAINYERRIEHSFMVRLNDRLVIAIKMRLRSKNAMSRIQSSSLFRCTYTLFIRYICADQTLEIKSHLIHHHSMIPRSFHTVVPGWTPSLNTAELPG